MALGMVVALGLTLAACAGAEDEGLEPEDLDPAAGEDGKFEAWNQANNPAYVISDALYYAHQLPIRGSGPKPIPSDYWATSKDNLNRKWLGSTSLSPAEKYAKSFGKPGTPENISKYHGVKSATWRKACSTNSDCTDQMDGSVCAASYDGAEKRCIPTWWGICHGWAPYALVEPAARNPVTRTAADGTKVTFYPGDIEAYMSLLYTEVPTKFISSRCNKDEPPTDSQGRLIDGECRDMNPGTWHIVVTNLLGLKGTGFVIDQTYDDEVWNQPARDFRVLNADGDKLKEITKDEAIRLVGESITTTSQFKDAAIAKDAKKEGTFTAPAAGEFTFKLSGSGDADLYVKKGAAPTESSYDCRPYDAGSIEECKVTAAAGDKIYWMVVGYAAESKVSLGVGAPGSGSATDYTYNPNARKWFHVEMEFRFIVEGDPSTTSHIDNLDAFTTTKKYSYVLEADEYGKIIGGEWIGASRENHPDFAWWPTGKPSPSQAGGLITYNEVKALNDESAGEVEPTGPVTILDDHTINTNGSRWNSKYVAVNVEAGTDKLIVEMTGSGDADLYVRKGQNPTVYVSNCKSVTAGTSTERCEVDVASGGGTYFVRARTRTPGTTVSITAEKIK